MIKQLHGGIWVGLLFVFLSLNAFAQTSDNQRFVGLMLLNLDRTPTAYQSLIDGSINAGANLVQLTIYWDEVHPTPTAAPNWQQPDLQIEQITKRGAKVAIRIMLARKMDKISGYWNDLERPQDFNFKPMEAIYGRTTFSLAATGAVQKAKDFVQEVCKRYEPYQQQGQILFVSFVNTPIQELGHHTSNYPEGDWQTSNPREFLSVYDYCPIAAATFRNWLKQHYSTIEKLSYHWQVKQSNWDNITIPHVWGADNQISLYKKRSAKEMYAFSHQMLKNFVQQMTEGIKAANQSYKVVNEYGSVIDLMSPLRNTLAFKDLDQWADGTKINNDVRYDHKFMTDVLRSNRPNKWIMNEVFYDRVSSSNDYLKQFDECFENGSKIVVFVIPDISFLSATQNVLKTAASRWLARPVAFVNVSSSIQYTVTEVLDSSATLVFNKWQKQAGTSRQPVDVQLVEDILNDDFWKKSKENVVPIIKKQIYDKAVKTKKTFTLKLDETFADPDGVIEKIEGINLPSWLKLQANELSGEAPLQVGDYTVRLRATDNEKAIVELSFKLSVVDLNQKPVLTSVLPNFQTYLNQYVEFNIKNYFDDPDGSIVRVQGRGLQSWMSVNTNTFAATPKSYGVFPITIRVFDEDSSWVEGSFTLTVLNQKPIVITSPTNKTIIQNKSFKYDLNKFFIFKDPDGNIERIKIFGLPNWAVFQNNIISGTAPSTLENHLLTFRAYDNAGDSTQTQIRLIVSNVGDNSNPPTIKKTIADTTVFITNYIEYKGLEKYFNDSNGYIDRVEVSNLPIWLTYKEGVLLGNAAAKGTFTVNIKAFDDDDNSVVISFKINVLEPKTTLMLTKAGPAGTRQELKELRSGETLKASALPARINIRIDSDLKPTSVLLELLGPVNQKITLEKFPFTVFDDAVGFEPTAGNYTLKTTITVGKTIANQIVTNFSIVPDNPIDDWVLFPNPVENTINLKLPNGYDYSNVELRLFSPFGKRIDIPKKYQYTGENSLYIDLKPLQLSFGHYLLIIYENDVLKKSIKFIKK